MMESQEPITPIVPGATEEQELQRNDVLPKPVEANTIFPVPAHDHDGVNSPTLSISNIQGSPMSKLADVELPASAKSFESPVFIAKSYLKVYVFINNRSASTNVNLQFNGDDDPNYNWRVSLSAGAPSTNPSASVIGLVDPGTGSLDKVQVSLDILNTKGAEKGVYGSAIEYPDKTSLNFIQILGVWDNEDNQITSIKVLSDGAQTFGPQSKLIIYGA